MIMIVVYFLLIVATLYTLMITNKPANILAKKKKANKETFRQTDTLANDKQVLVATSSNKQIVKSPFLRTI